MASSSEAKALDAGAEGDIELVSSDNQKVSVSRAAARQSDLIKQMMEVRFLGCSKCADPCSS